MIVVCLSHRAQRLEVVGNSLLADGIRTSCVVGEKRSVRERNGWKEWWTDTSRNEVTGSEIQREKKSVKTILGEEGEGCEREEKEEEEWEVMF